MNKRLQILILSSLPWLIQPIPAVAQDNEPARPSTTDAGEAAPEEEISASQEVEITEDNYRQFMELKDAMRQRDVIPENIFKPGSGLQKLDKLPEESQKHLRNQLREIIVQGDPWQPGDEETVYPYTPSPAARTNPALEKQELEAWGELVDSYHERESQIYENSSGMQAARGSEQGSSNSQQNGEGPSGRQGQNGEGSEGQQAGQQGNADQPDTEGTYSLDGSTDSSANSTAGVSQNAMEFLRGLGRGGSGPEAANDGNPGQNNGQGAQSTASTAGTTQSAMEFLKGNATETGGLVEAGAGQSGAPGESVAHSPSGDQGEGSFDGSEQGGEQAMAQAPGAQGAGQEGERADSPDGEKAQDGQLAKSSESSVSIAQPDNSMLDSPDQPEEESTAGASQNAFEYLTSEAPGAIDGVNHDAGDEQPDGTLSIQELLNAQGLDNSSVDQPAPTIPDDENDPDGVESDNNNDS